MFINISLNNYANKIFRNMLDMLYITQILHNSLQNNICKLENNEFVYRHRVGIKNNNVNKNFNSKIIVFYMFNITINNTIIFNILLNRSSLLITITTNGYTKKS